jgi:hypothetical protein
MFGSSSSSSSQAVNIESSTATWPRNALDCAVNYFQNYKQVMLNGGPFQSPAIGYCNVGGRTGKVIVYDNVKMSLRHPRY